MILKKATKDAVIYDCHSKIDEWQYVLLVSDLHLDSILAKTKLIKHMFKEALNKNAFCFLGGDTYDIMHNFGDPRGGKGELNPDLKTDTYQDSIVDMGVNLLKPYTEIIKAMGDGNHESENERRHGTNLTKRTLSRLNDGTENIQYLGYCKYIILSVRSIDENNSKGQLKIWYHHGAGGNSPVTKGGIAANRRSVYLSNADIVWSGHTHFADLTFHKKEKISARGMIIPNIQTHIVTPALKDPGKWETQKNMPPQPTGWCWLKYRWRWGGVLEYRTEMELY